MNTASEANSTRIRREKGYGERVFSEVYKAYMTDMKHEKVSYFCDLQAKKEGGTNKSAIETIFYRYLNKTGNELMKIALEEKQIRKLEYAIEGAQFHYHETIGGNKRIKYNEKGPELQKKKGIQQYPCPTVSDTSKSFHLNYPGKPQTTPGAFNLEPNLRLFNSETQYPPKFTTEGNKCKVDESKSQLAPQKLDKSFFSNFFGEQSPKRKSEEEGINFSEELNLATQKILKKAYP